MEVCGVPPTMQSSARGRALHAFTAVQTGSSLTLGALLVIHLAAPVTAAVSGAESANATMVRVHAYCANASFSAVSCIRTDS